MGCDCSTYLNKEKTGNNADLIDMFEKKDGKTQKKRKRKAGSGTIFDTPDDHSYDPDSALKINLLKSKINEYDGSKPSSLTYALLQKFYKA